MVERWACNHESRCSNPSHGELPLRVRAPHIKMSIKYDRANDRAETNADHKICINAPRSGFEQMVPPQAVGQHFILSVQPSISLRHSMPDIQTSPSSGFAAGGQSPTLIRGLLHVSVTHMYAYVQKTYKNNSHSEKLIQ